VRVGKRALFNRLHPAAVDADRDLMLGLAGDRACVTADALAEIDDEAEIRHGKSRIRNRRLSLSRADGGLTKTTKATKKDDHAD
jgi:hypothetical protein